MLSNTFFSFLFRKRSKVFYLIIAVIMTFFTILMPVAPNSHRDENTFKKSWKLELSEIVVISSF